MEVEAGIQAMRVSRRAFVWPLLGLPGLAAQDYASLRDAMVREQIEQRGIRDRRVLAALRATPRHIYVPPQFRAQAYADHPLPIASGQTISQPYIVAVMTELLAVEPGHKVLEIGTGSGYQAAVLARLAKHVFTIEIIPELARVARAIFEQQQLRNITVREGDGYKGWPEEAPFDRIIVTAAPPSMPQALLNQLKPGGKLVAPIGTADQELMLFQKDQAGRITKKSVLPVRFVPMVPGKQ